MTAGATERGRLPTAPGTELPVDVYATPIRAVKWVRMRRWRNTVAFAPLHDHGDDVSVYAADADAVCGHGQPHRAPDEHCRCGFYAVAGPDELGRIAGPSLLYGYATVLLAGKVVEHTNGWRASHQHVEQVTVVNRCHRCGSTATWLSVARNGRDVAPVCSRHRRRLHWALEEAAEALGCPVQWADTGDIADRTRTGTHILATVAVPLAITTVAASVTMAGGSPAFAAAAGPVALVAAAATWPARQRNIGRGYEADRVTRKVRAWLFGTTATCWGASAAVAFMYGYWPG